MVWLLIAGSVTVSCSPYVGDCGQPGKHCLGLVFELAQVLNLGPSLLPNQSCHLTRINYVHRHMDLF